MPRLRPFAFAAKSGIGYPGKNGFGLGGNLEGGCPPWFTPAAHAPRPARSLCSPARKIHARENA
jgi:hypothetical protein